MFLFLRISGWAGILIGLGMWYEVGRGLWYGEIEVSGRYIKTFMFPREVDPFIFYAYVAVYSLMGLGLIALGVYGVRNFKGNAK